MSNREEFGDKGRFDKDSRERIDQIAYEIDQVRCWKMPENVRDQLVNWWKRLDLLSRRMLAAESEARTAELQRSKCEHCGVDLTGDGIDSFYREYQYNRRIWALIEEVESARRGVATTHSDDPLPRLKREIGGSLAGFSMTSDRLAARGRPEPSEASSAVPLSVEDLNEAHTVIGEMIEVADTDGMDGETVIPVWPKDVAHDFAPLKVKHIRAIARALTALERGSVVRPTVGARENKEKS